MPQLQKIWEELKEKDVIFIGIEAFNETKMAKKFIKKNKIKFLLLEDEKDGNKKVYQKYSVYAFPTTFIFNKNKKLIGYHLGYEEGLEEKIKGEILKELK